MTLLVCPEHLLFLHCFRTWLHAGLRLWRPALCAAYGWVRKNINHRHAMLKIIIHTAGQDCCILSTLGLCCHSITQLQGCVKFPTWYSLSQILDFSGFARALRRRSLFWTSSVSDGDSSNLKFRCTTCIIVRSFLKLQWTMLRCLFVVHFSFCWSPKQSSEQCVVSKVLVIAPHKHMPYPDPWVQEFSPLLNARLVLCFYASSA